MKKILLIATLLLTNSVFAQKVGFVGGINYTGGEVDAGGGLKVDFDREFGLQLGARYLVDINDVQLRTGAALSLFRSSIDTNFSGTSVDADYSTIFLSIPITMQKMFSEQFGLFGGLGLNVNVSEDYELKADGVVVVDDADTESLWLTLQIGAVYMFTETLGGEFVFDYGLNDIAEDGKANSFLIQIVSYF